LSAAQLETTREFKLCALPDPMASDYPLPGVTHVLDRARPPTITFAIPQSVATPRPLFHASTFEAEVEGCTENCDRYFIGEPGADPVRWDEAKRCVL
jgi:hypothetical protein